MYDDPRRASWPASHETRVIDFPEPPPRANLSENPTYVVRRSEASVTVDGRLDSDEWGGLEENESMVLEAGVANALVSPPARAWSTSPSCSICMPWIRPRLPPAQAPPTQ